MKCETLLLQTKIIYHQGKNALRFALNSCLTAYFTWDNGGKRFFMRRKKGSSPSTYLQPPVQFMIILLTNRYVWGRISHVRDRDDIYVGVFF